MRPKIKPRKIWQKEKYKNPLKRNFWEILSEGISL